MAAEWSIEPLSASHERDAFCCGKPLLDDYLRKYAKQHARKNMGRTFVAVRPGEKKVVGYYTLASSAVAFEHLPDGLKKKLPRYPVPVALLGRLAVDQSAQGQGLGATLLLDALRRCIDIAEQLAIFGVEVDALDESARQFYARYGFQAFQDEPLHLFLPLDTIMQLF